MTHTFNATISVTAENEEIAAKKIKVLNNLLQNFDEQSFMDVYAKICKEPTFFQKLKKYLKLL